MKRGRVERLRTPSQIGKHAAASRVPDSTVDAKDRSHQSRMPAPMENPHHPKRLLVRCISYEVLVAHDMESQRSSSQVRASVSDVW